MDKEDTPTTPDGKLPSERLKLVSENNPHEVERNCETGRTRDALDNAVAVLTANLLRVLAGAGQRHQITYDMA
jgi:hypothetical protein